MTHTACNHTSQVVGKPPICHFCLAKAAYEANTVFGYRAFLCSRDFKRIGVDPEEARPLNVIDSTPKFSFVSLKRLLHLGRIGLGRPALA